MTRNQIEFESTDAAALDYIRMRGYCSYSSMCNVREKREPSTYSSPAQVFGHELHSRFLEHKKLVTLGLYDEWRLKQMVTNLAEDVMVQRIMENAAVEQDFDVSINGLRMCGRIDILPRAVSVADLKTTKCSKLSQFVASMDFLQAAIYKRAKLRKEFYYVGSCKLPPFHPIVFSTGSYSNIMNDADNQLDYWSRYIKNKL